MTSSNRTIISTGDRSSKDLSFKAKVYRILRTARKLQEKKIQTPLPHLAASLRAAVPGFPSPCAALCMGLSGLAAMNRWPPPGHSYSNPRNTFTVRPMSATGKSGKKTPSQLHGELKRASSSNVLTLPPRLEVWPLHGDLGQVRPVGLDVVPVRLADGDVPRKQELGAGDEAGLGKGN